MTIQLQNSLDKSTIETFSSRHNEPEWFKNLRLEAASKYEELEMPKPDKTKIDKWNFTDFKQHTVENEPFKDYNDFPEEVKALIDAESGVKTLYVQQNQTASFLNVSDQLKEQGVVFTDLLTAVKEHGDLVQKYFMTDGVKVDEHRLAAFHAALVNGGAFLYIPKNLEVTEPIQSIFIHDNEDTPLINHVLIVADENSSVTYVENYVSLGEVKEGIANIVAEVIALDGAKINYGAVDTLSEGLTIYVNRRGVCGRDARIDWSLGAMNDGDTISENITYLMGDGSWCEANMVTVGRGNQTQNFTSNITHFGKRSEGFILGHGVVNDSATVIVNGIGKIEHGAVGANAQQENRLMMLNDKARGDANPILLIEENDVYAGHAASVGRVDELQLYYMMSRGISKEDAERLIIFGFLAPVVEKLPIEGVKKQLTEVIERKLR